MDVCVLLSFTGEDVCIQRGEGGEGRERREKRNEKQTGKEKIEKKKKRKKEKRERGKRKEWGEGWRLGCVGMLVTFKSDLCLERCIFE